METKDILILVGAGAIGYYLYNKSKQQNVAMDLSQEYPLGDVSPQPAYTLPSTPAAVAQAVTQAVAPAPTAPIPMPTSPSADTTLYTYPQGIGKDGSKFELKDGDYVANGEETAILYQGKLRPMTAAYANKFAAGTWERTKILDNIVYSSIPRGAVLDV